MLFLSEGIRRKFFEVHVASGAPLAKEALDHIGALYGLENTIRGKPSDLRRQCREEEALPRVTAFRDWIEVTLPELSAKTEIAAAMRYALGRWASLTRYLHDGRIEIDNNAAERAIRAVALGRKNYLFAGSDSVDERAAAIYSLIESAKLNRLDPEVRLRSVPIGKGYKTVLTKNLISLTAESKLMCSFSNTTA